MTTVGKEQAGVGLTTTKAPFIEQAQQEGRLYIHQPYELYSEANHDAWKRLFARMEERWRRYANTRFLQGIDSLCLEPSRVPRLDDVNRFLSPLTGFKAKPVSGYIPSFLFFNSLRNREFPTTITIRDGATLDYLPEPDIFHDIAGHVPMHTDRAFADTLVRFGDCAHTAAEIVAGIKDEKEKIRRVTSIFKAMARFFWFTIEFGLMRGADGLRVYGSGLLAPMARSRTPLIRLKYSAIQSSSNGSSINTSKSITTSLCSSSSIPSITFSIWSENWSGGCGKAGWTMSHRESPQSVSPTCGVFWRPRWPNSCLLDPS